MMTWKSGLILLAGFVFGSPMMAFAGEPISPRMIEVATPYFDLITSKRFTDAISTNGDEGAELKARLDRLELTMIRNLPTTPTSQYFAGDVDLLALLLVTRVRTFDIPSEHYHGKPRDYSLLNQVAACQTLAKFSVKTHSFAGWKAGSELCLDIEPGTPPLVVLGTAQAYLKSLLSDSEEKQKQYLMQRKQPQ